MSDADNMKRYDNDRLSFVTRSRARRIEAERKVEEQTKHEPSLSTKERKTKQKAAFEGL